MCGYVCVPVPVCARVYMHVQAGHSFSAFLSAHLRTAAHSLKQLPLEFVLSCSGLEHRKVDTQKNMGHATCSSLTHHMGFYFSFSNGRVLSPRNHANSTCVCTHTHHDPLLSLLWPQGLNSSPQTWQKHLGLWRPLTAPSEKLDEVSWQGLCILEKE